MKSRRVGLLYKSPTKKMYGWGFSAELLMLPNSPMDFSTLKVRQSNGATLTFGPMSRDSLVVRANELVVAGLVDAEFFLDGELLDLATLPTEEHSDLNEDPETIDAEYLEADPDRAHSPAPPETRAPPLDPREAGAIAENLLASATKLHNDLLDSAARRTAEQAATMAALEEAQVQRQLATAKKLQDFVGGMNATLAQERLAAFQIKSHELQLAEQAAAKEYAKQLAIAEANKPSPVMILAELAVSFTANLARNSAANFTEMNSNPKD